jgi:hypothetical protein
MSQELENHRDLRPFLLLCNPILFQNDNNPPEIFLMKKIIYVHVENVRVYEFCLSRNISIKKNQKKKQIYYILRYSVKIVLSTHTNSFPFTCPFYVINDNYMFSFKRILNKIKWFCLIHFNELFEI